MSRPGTYNRYEPSLPALTIANCGGRKMGNCYHASFSLITSNRPLCGNEIYALRAAGFLPAGQEMYFYQCDRSGKQMAADVPETRAAFKHGSANPPASYQDIGAVVEYDFETGAPTGRPAVDYSGDFARPIQTSYWCYHVEVRADSGD